MLLSVRTIYVQSLLQMAVAVALMTDYLLQPTPKIIPFEVCVRECVRVNVCVRECVRVSVCVRECVRMHRYISFLV